MRRLLDDPHLLRRVTYATGGGAAVISMVTTLALAPDDYEALATYAIPLAVFASLPSQRWRSTVLAAGAGFVAVFATGNTATLWLGVAALVFGSVAEDLRAVPWVGWVGGLAGAVLSLFVEGSPTIGPFFGVILGGSLGLLCAPGCTRSSSRERPTHCGAGRPGWRSGRAWPASSTTWSATT